MLLPAAAARRRGVALAYARAAGVRSFVTVLAPAPLVFLVLFLVLSPVSQLLRPEPTVHAATGSPGRTPVVLVVFDELPTISLMGDRRRIDAERYPGFARLARDVDVVSQRDDRRRRHDVAVPAILTGLRPGRSVASRPPGVSPQPLHAARRPLATSTRRAGHRRLPAAASARRAPAPRTGERLGSLASDLSVVAGHLVLPGDIADTLPPIDRDCEDFGAVAGRAWRRELARTAPPSAHAMTGGPCA